MRLCVLCGEINSSQLSPFSEPLYSSGFPVKRTTSKDAEEALLKIAIEGLKVKFSGKVYEMNKEFAKDNKLPNDVKLYSLVSPDYSITILDEQ